MTTGTQIEPGIDGRLVAVVCLMGAFALSIGFLYPALALVLEARGVAPGVIGAQAAMTGFGIAVGSLATPWLAIRFGVWRIGAVALALTIVLTLGFGVFQSLASWFVLRLLVGLTIPIIFVISETWINELAPERLRGRIVAIYISILSGLFALGPILLTVIGHEGMRPFVVTAAIIGVMALPYWWLRDMPNLEPIPFSGFVKTLAIIPVLLLAVSACGYVDGATLGLWVVYAIERGLDADGSARTLTAFIVGNMLLQVPIGWIADRTSRRAVLVVCAGGAFFGALVLDLVPIDGIIIWPFLIVWGALCFGVWTLAMTLAGTHLRGSRLISANAGFSVMWGVGSLVGAAVTGGAMEVLGTFGLPISVAAIYVALFAASLVIKPVRSVG